MEAAFSVTFVNAQQT